MFRTGQRMILASASEARRRMLEDAGIKIHIEPANIEEESVKADATALDISDAGLSHVAVRLAIAKAAAVSALHPDSLVIGSDQILILDNEIFSKPADMAAARNQLMRLRGRSHELHSAAAIACEGRAEWHAVTCARLTMRDFTEVFLDAYLDLEGDYVCASVGGYRIEGPGLQLFEKMDGDFFTILGMPMLELLAELRRRGAIAA